jgi:Holliday junction resolvase RusA-like endonuclease
MNLTLDIPDESIVVCVRVPGEPQAWLRAGRDGNRTFNPKANVDAKNNLRWAIHAAHPGRFPKQMDCVNRFGIAFIAETQKWNTDIDNLEKQILDSTQGFVFQNDAQVDEVWKRAIRGADKPNLQLIIYRTKCSLGGKEI